MSIQDRLEAIESGINFIVKKEDIEKEEWKKSVHIDIENLEVGNLFYVININESMRRENIEVGMIGVLRDILDKDAYYNCYFIRFHPSNSGFINFYCTEEELQSNFNKIKI